MNLGALVSETRHPDSMALDSLSTLEMVRLFNQQDKLVPEAIASELPAVAAAIDRAAQALGAGGRLIYLGAGTSGRLAGWGCWMRRNARRPSACRQTK